MVGGNLVAYLEQYFTRNRGVQRVVLRGRADIRPAPYLYIWIVNMNNHRVINDKALRFTYLRVIFTEFARVYQLAGDGRSCRGLRADQVYPRRGSSGTPVEVAVVGTYRYRVGFGRLPHSDAEAAGGFHYARPARYQVGQMAVGSYHIEYLFGAGGD